MYISGQDEPRKKKERKRKTSKKRTKGSYISEKGNAEIENPAVKSWSDAEDDAEEKDAYYEEL